MTIQLLGGVSQGEYNPYNNGLFVRGWFLPREAYDAVVICAPDGEKIGEATLGLRRDDVYNKHAEFNEPCAGWKYEGTINNWPGKDGLVSVRVVKNNIVVKELHYAPERIEGTVEAIRTLKKNYLVNENGRMPVNHEQIRQDLEANGIPVVSYPMNADEWHRWMECVDYPRHYPDYVQCFKQDLAKKMAQHYLSIQMLSITSDDIVMDVASSISVFPDILVRCHEVKHVWRQDMEYENGVHGRKIGGFASKIPLPDNSLDVITLHCSLEHFEDGEDARFFAEGMRLLRQGGRICVIPLYMANHTSIMTSPSVWAKKYQAYNEAPHFDQRATIYIDESIRQRQHKYYDAKALSEDLGPIMAQASQVIVFDLENYAQINGCPAFALLITKK